MTDPGSQRSKRMPQNCPAEIADEKPSRRQFVDLKLIDHALMLKLTEIDSSLPVKKTTTLPINFHAYFNSLIKLIT